MTTRRPSLFFALLFSLGCLLMSDATLVTAQAAVPQITSPGTASGKIGQPFVYQITATNIPDSYGTGALPAGLSTDIPTGVISGTPTVRGTFNVTLAAANADGTGYGTVVLTIADAVQPTITVTSPPGAIKVVVGNPVPLAASVDDPDGVLAQVAFFVNGLPVGSTTSGGPFYSTAAAPSPGVYVVSAVATDTEGRQSTGSVTITAVQADPSNPAPTADLLTPLNGLNLAAGSTVTLDAAAFSASAGGLDHVSIMVDGATVATFDAAGNLLGGQGQAVSASTRRRDASGSSSGGLFQAKYTLPGLDKLLSMIVAATDQLGQTSLTPVANFHAAVTTDRAPQVAFSNLASNVQVAVGASQQASVAASDPDAAVAAIAAASASGRPVRQDAASDAVLAQLTYFLNGVNIGQSVLPPYAFNFAAPAPGKYTLHAVATDGSGLSTVSEPVLVEAFVPVVSVRAAGDGLAVEGGEKGKVIIARTGDTSAPLSVFYKTKGSAVAGTDFVALSGNVVIPAGASQVKVKVRALDDTLHQSAARRAKVKLLPSPDGLYQVGDPFLARIAITDND